MPALSSTGSLGTGFTLCIPEHPWARAEGTAGGTLCLQEGAGASLLRRVAGSALLGASQPAREEQGWMERSR